MPAAPQPVILEVWNMCVLSANDPDKRLEPDEELLPTLTLSPEPAEWPDPRAFLEEDEERPE